jgi:hypothetical protein
MDNQVSVWLESSTDKPPRGAQVERIHGTTPGRQRPRQIDIRLHNRGEQETISLFIHPPTSTNGYEVRVPAAALRDALRRLTRSGR